MAQATQGMEEGTGKWMKTQAVVWACTDVTEGVRVHEMWPREQAMCRQGCCIVPPQPWTDSPHNQTRSIAFEW